MKKVILFDLDGTLMNTKEGITKCAAYALKHYGIYVEDLDSLDFFIGPPLHKSFEEFYGFDEKKATEAASVYRERYRDIGVYECEPYTGIEEVLNYLFEKGYQLAVATSKPEIFAKQIMEKFKFSKYFVTIVGSLLDNSRSSKKEVIEEAFAQLGVGTVYQKSEVLMVGDRKHDIIGAKQTGIETLGVKYGFARENELQEAGADYIAEQPQDIIRIIRELEEK